MTISRVRETLLYELYKEKLMRAVEMVVVVACGGGGSGGGGGRRFLATLIAQQ